MSYEAFYGIKEQPFSNAPNSRFYYDTDEHGEAMARIFHAIETNKGLVVMIGDSGTGKTLLGRRILERLEEKGGFEAGLLVIIHTEVTAEWMLRKIASQMGVSQVKETKGEIISQVFERLMEIHEQGKKAVILIDEANMLMKKEIYEEFRGLLNLEIPGQKLVNIVLMGMPELEEFMRQDPPLVQRVALKFRLKNLGEESTRKYIQHRLRIAGAEGPVFNDDALKAIYRWSSGFPRLINTVCDNALLEGYLRKKRLLDAGDIDEVGQGLGLRPQEAGGVG